MTSEYFRGYHIPLVVAPEAHSRQVCLSVNLSDPSTLTNSGTYFLAPGKEKMSVGMETEEIVLKDIEPDSALATQRKLKRKMNEAPIEDSNNLVMFQGRDESYPEELNKLIQPLSCQLCKTQMTSMKSAKDHYESKAHDRHISAWLAKNYTEVGLQMPPIKRLVKQGPTGPNAFHCHLCDLALTSMTHARQHYAGRKHQLVAQKRTKPSGAGFYNMEGNWVRTGTKAEVFPDDNRFGIGELFIKSVPVAKIQQMDTGTLTTNGEHQQQAIKNRTVNESLTCNVCKISVTSESQIKMHLDGVKHQKNLRKQILGENASTLITLAADGMQEQSICTALGAATPDAEEDLSMYRTPSGLYYCKLCNKAMNHISILQQHLQGKKHLKTVRVQADKMMSP